MWKYIFKGEFESCIKETAIFSQRNIYSDKSPTTLREPLRDLLRVPEMNVAF